MHIPVEVTTVDGDRQYINLDTDPAVKIEGFTCFESKGKVIYYPHHVITGIVVQ